MPEPETNMQRRYRERKSAGLCVYCGKDKPIPERGYCALCAERMRKQACRRYEMLKSYNRCTSCGKSLSAGHKGLLCGPCARRRSARRNEGGKDLDP